MLKSVLIFHTL